MKTALITGVNGQDGIYLAGLLCEKGYRVIGIDIQSDKRAQYKIKYLQGSVANPLLLAELIEKNNPDEIYNLASISSVTDSYRFPEETFSVNLLPVIQMLELIRNKFKGTKFLQATSSEIFGGRAAPPYDEESKLEPLSPYAVSKEAAYQMVKIYRRTYGIFAANAILFNHTSPFHSANFVVPKLVRGLVEAKLGKRAKIQLGNLEVERDWGYAGDYVGAMHLILGHSAADDYVVGSGKYRKLRSLVDYILEKLDLKYDSVIEIDRSLFRSNDAQRIYSDPSKIMRTLHWHSGTEFNAVLDMMIEEELKRQRGQNE
jgi:GDPmannose 4,6-dehydratase